MKKNLLVSLTCALMLISGTAIGEDRTFPAQRQQVWLARNEAIISATLRTNTNDPAAYVGGLKSACNGLMGEQMSGHMPYWAATPQGNLCNAINALATEIHTMPRGFGFAPSTYCGQLDSAIRGLGNIQPYAENPAINESATRLIAAAEQIKANEYAAPRRTLKCR